MERPYLPSITALLCSSWAYLNEFLIQPSGRGSKCTLESANFSRCIVNVCVSVLILLILICIIICIYLFRLLFLNLMGKSTVYFIL